MNVVSLEMQLSVHNEAIREAFSSTSILMEDKHLAYICPMDTEVALKTQSRPLLHLRFQVE